jgi:putative redox protein
MSDITNKLVWNGALRFTGRSANGHEIIIDGNREGGASPMEILLEALGACSAIDLVVILEKSRTPAQRLEVTLAADRRASEPRYFTTARVRFDVWGIGIRPEAVARAIKLSFSKYCSVYHSLRSDLKLQPEYRLHAPDAAAEGEYQLVEIGVPTGELG